jgi:hypothetical protein
MTGHIVNGWETVRCGGSILHEHRHVCAFFRSFEQENRCFMPFVREGFNRGDRHVRFVKEDVGLALDYLRGEGIDVDAAIARRQLAVFDAGDTYLQDGAFDANRMIAGVQALLDEGRALGFRRTRLIAHCEHMVMSEAYSEAFVEYESRVNDVLQREDVVICTYDIDALTAGQALDILRAHPVAIIEGTLRTNPYYVPTERLLRDFAERRSFL